MSLPLLVDNHMEASSLLYKYSVAFVILNYGFIIADLSGAVNHHYLKIILFLIKASLSGNAK